MREPEAVAHAARACASRRAVARRRRSYALVKRRYDRLPAEEKGAALREKQARVEKEETARYQQRIEEELKTGRCTKERANALRDLVGVASWIFGDKFTMNGHDIVVATPEGTAVDTTGWLGGETHVGAVGASKVRLVALDKRGW